MTDPQTETIHHDLNATEWALLQAEKDRAETIMARAQQLAKAAGGLLPAAYRTILSVYGLELTGAMCEVDPEERVLTAVIKVPEVAADEWDSREDLDPEPVNPEDLRDHEGEVLVDLANAANLDLLEHDVVDTDESVDALVEAETASE